MFVCFVALLVSIALSGDCLAGSVQVEFKLDASRFEKAYESEVYLNVNGAKAGPFQGSVRPTPGNLFPTINQGCYQIALGLHHRKTAKMKDPSRLTAVQHATIKNSRATYGATTKHYLGRYVHQKDGSWLLPESEKEAIGWMRKVLTVTDVDHDVFVISETVGTPRLCLILERDANKVRVTRPAPDSPGGRKAGTAGLVHIHSGPSDRRSAEGCLTLPEGEWKKFLEPIVKAYPTIDDWLSDGYIGKDVGEVTVTAD